MSDSLCLLVEVPVCAFRPYASREYQDTYPVPTPASVYGMLLSLLGIRREHKDRHRGVEFALAVEARPERSKVFRKLRRGADLEDIRPDYQDLLTELRLWIWVRRGAEVEAPCLEDRLRSGFAEKFAGVKREGGLSLGESSYLVNAITATVPTKPLHFVLPKADGFYSLPVWVDHAAASNTVTHRFSIDEDKHETLSEEHWFQIPLPTPTADAAPAAKKSRAKPK